MGAPLHLGTTERPATGGSENQGPDPEEAVGALLRDLRSSPDGLTSAEAQRRVLQYGSNELTRHEGVNWAKEVWSQFTQPLALLLWVAAGLEFAISSSTIGIAIVLVILINAIMSLAEERQAERSVEALSAYLPQQTTAMRDGRFAGLFMYVPPLQNLLGTTSLPPRYLLLLLPYPFIVLGADELRKWAVRRHSPGR
jgi:hypothetical protein